MQELKNGENFANLVKKYSIDPYTKDKDGELDWFGLDDMQKEFKEVSFNSKKIGDISNIIKTDYGLLFKN